MKNKLARFLKTTPDGCMTPRGERLSYWVYFFGQNIFYFIVFQFLTTYMLFLGIDPAKLGGVMLAVKIWDAVNDPLFGVIFDKVKFKSGKKAVPWLRLSTAALPLATIFMFVIPPSIGENAKLWWFAAAYLLYDTFYTICDVPIFSMVTTMTDNLNERNTLMSFGRIFSGAGGGFCMAVVTVLISEKVGLGFGPVSIILSVIAVIAMLPICIFGKERNYKPEAQEESFTIRAMLKYIAHNKYLLIYYLGYFFTAAAATGGAMSVFVSYYLFGSAIFSLIIGALGVVPTFVFAVLVPKMIKKVDKFQLLFWCNLLNMILGFVMFFAGWENKTAFIVLSIVRSIPGGIVGIINFMFTPDCAEYGQFKTGVDAKGITFAVQTFSAKITAAVASSLGLFVLKFFDWKEITATDFAELEALGITQSPRALEGLWVIYALIPAIGMALSTICYLFYKLRDKDVQIMAKCNAGEITREEAEKQLSRRF